MNHQERLELLGALSRAGATYYKSHDLEIQFGELHEASKVAIPATQVAKVAEVAVPQAPAPQENEDATKKLTDLIETLKMDDASLLDKIFPAGAGI